MQSWALSLGCTCCIEDFEEEKEPPEKPEVGPVQWWTEVKAEGTFEEDFAVKRLLGKVSGPPSPAGAWPEPRAGWRSSRGVLTWDCADARGRTRRCTRRWSGPPTRSSRRRSAS